MSTLKTQYKNYLKIKPDSKLTYGEWLEELSTSLAEATREELKDWDVTLDDGLENEPYVSDDFQIGPDGAYEHTEKDYSPYCPICNGCGEDGCCSALMCKQDPKGDYCQTYLKELQFAYRMYNDLMELLDKDEKYEKQIDELWNKNYDLTYKD